LLLFQLKRLTGSQKVLRDRAINTKNYTLPFARKAWGQGFVEDALGEKSFLNMKHFFKNKYFPDLMF